jgi:hypothetical protein
VKVAMWIFVKDVFIKIYAFNVKKVTFLNKTIKFVNKNLIIVNKAIILNILKKNVFPV